MSVTVWVTLGAVILLAHFYSSYLYPSAYKILFLQTVTGTRTVPLSQFTSSYPQLLDEASCSLWNFCYPLRLVLPQAELAAAVASPAGDGLLDSPAPYGHLRYNAKLHVVSQPSLYLDYPISLFLIRRLRLLEVFPWLTANLVTLVHPLVGLAAGYLFWKAGKLLSWQVQQAADDDDCSSSVVEMIKDSGFEESLRLRRLNKRAISFTAGEDGVPMEAASSPPPPPMTASSVDSAAVTDMLLAGGSKNIERARRLRWIGCALFILRNFLDALDGVIARERSTTVAVQAAATTLSFNSHTLDVVCDVAGGTFCCIGILLFVNQQGLGLHHRLRELLLWMGLPRRLHTRASKWIAFWGLFLVPVTSSVWELFMLRYVNLFDRFSPSNVDVFQLESRSLHLLVNQLLWAFLCADFMFVVFCVALCFDKIWIVLQYYATFGYAALLVGLVYSMWTWNYVILANPTAAHLYYQQQPRQSFP